MKPLAAVLSLVLVAACSGDGATPTTTEPPTTTTAVGTTTPPTTTTPTTPPVVTTTTEAPPPTEPNPEMFALAGVWREAGTRSWYFHLAGHGVITTGSSPELLTNSGYWTLRDDHLVVWNLDMGTGGCGEAEGVYGITRAGSSLTLRLLDDPCTHRANLLTRNGSKRYELEP